MKMDAPELPQLSVVIPAHNERENLPALFGELRAMLSESRLSHEIVLVDDGSTDGTAAWLADEARRDPCIEPVLLPRRVGQSGALAAGFARARGRWVATMDADLQNDPADLPRLLAALDGADVVSGRREDRHDRWLRRVSSRVANGVRRGVLGDSFHDIGCSLKAYRREALEQIPLFVGVHRFLPALCEFRGARVAEIAVHHRPRRHGRSKYGVSNRLGRALVDLFGVRWLKSRLIRYPLREEKS